MARADYSITVEEQRQFLETIKPLVIKACDRVGRVPASIVAAQAILESFWGKGDELDASTNNLFGQKAMGEDPWANGIVSVSSKEYNGKGEAYPQTSTFWTYPSWEASIESHCDYLVGVVGDAWTKSIYSVPRSLDIVDFATWLVTPPRSYATDPKYPEKLVSLIDQWNLAGWDDELGKESPTDPTVGEEDSSEELPDEGSNGFIISFDDEATSTINRLSSSVEALNKTIDTLLKEVFRVR